jgi:acylphosphatase
VTDSPRARHLLVHGRVQGVFFRASMQEAAARHGVAGWVRNRPSGEVEAVVEGPAEAVEALVAWAHDGPAGARVERVEVTDASPEGLRGFEVR